MSVFSFDFSGFAKLSKDVQKIGTNVQKSETAIVKLAANEYKNDVQPKLPYKTGTLRRSAHVEIQEGIRPVALVGTNVVYARQREYGGIILAKKKPFLVFKIGDKWIRTKSVYQPARPVWRPVFDHNKAKYERILKNTFNRAVWEEDVATFEGVRPDLTGGIL